MRCFSTRPPEGQAHSGDWWRHGTRPLDEPPLPRARRERCDLWPPRGRAGADGRGTTKETGAEIETVRCDVRLPDAVEPVMDRIWQKRPPDILVNNAAGQILAPTHRMSSRAIDAVLGIVLHGSAYCTVAAGRRWIDAG